MLTSLLALSVCILGTIALPAQSMRWTEARANEWYANQPWLVGANYVPSDAINQFEMFQAATWNPKLNDKELGLAESVGMNTVRVFLQDQLWSQDSVGLTKRLDEFLAIAAKHHIRPILVLFDSCWDPSPALGRQHPPVAGVHNSGWVQSPGRRELSDSSYEPKLRAYVEGIVGAFAKDSRVLAWDVWNEPDNLNASSYAKAEDPDKINHVDHLLPLAFAWARAANPSQPLTSGVWHGMWGDPSQQSETTKIQLTESDIITFHNYEWPERFEARIRELLPFHRPILCTEYMARGAGSTFDSSLPVAKKYHVAAINWGLVAGKTQTYLPWDSWQRPYVNTQPTIWFHEVFRQDDNPYREREVELLRQFTSQGTATNVQ